MSQGESTTAAPLPAHLSAGCGLLMGGADAIPGVSGGTIALILGIYERFIGALNTMIKSPALVRSADGRRDIADALRFLLPLGFGIAVAYYLATKLLVGPDESPGLMRRPDTAPACYAFFFGLVLVSIREPWRRAERRAAPEFVAAALGCAAAVVFVGLPHRSAEPAMWALALGGAGAISVMLLPGVSGSLFLVIIGHYEVVTRAVHNRDLGVVAVFLVGLGLGAVTFVPVLRLLLKKYHSTTLAALTGLMAGSLRALWPWKSNYDSKSGPMDNVGIGDGVPWVVIALLCGGAVVLLLARLERKLAQEATA